MEAFYDILILGGGIAGLSAAKAARETAPEASLCLVCGEAVLPYSRPMLTKIPLEQYNVEHTLVQPPAWYRENRVNVLLGTRVLSLNAQAQTVETTAGTLAYGKCVYALGASNFVPPFYGNNLPGVLDIRSYGDMYAIKRHGLGAQNAVIVGGGVIGLEAAYILAERGLSVTVLETAPYLLPRLLDEDSARLLASRITAFRVHTGVKVLGIAGEKRAEAVEVEGMPPFPAQMVILSCGVRANASAAQQAGVQMGRSIIVNSRMETSLPGLYACGDCAEFEGVNTGLWAQAKAQGAVAGANAAGADACYQGSDMALMLTCPEFCLYSEGDLGKDPQKTYSQESVEVQAPPGFKVNPRPAPACRRSFYAGGKLAGTFLLGNLSQMHSLHRELWGDLS